MNLMAENNSGSLGLFHLISEINFINSRVENPLMGSRSHIPSRLAILSEDDFPNFPFGGISSLEGIFDDIFTYIWLIFMVNVNTISLDGMGHGYGTQKWRI